MSGKYGFGRLAVSSVLILIAALAAIFMPISVSTPTDENSLFLMQKSWAASKIDVVGLSISSISDKYYTGKPICPKPTVKYGNTVLKVDRDYKLAYKNNTVKGTATIVIKGCGNYSGTRSISFRILPKTSIAKAKVTVAKQGYTGKALTPTATVVLGSKTLKLGTDYSVKYANNIAKGTATVTITGKGHYTGQAKGTFKIVARTAISKLSISSISAQTYSGSALKPKPTVKRGGTVLKEGRDYRLAYKNNKTKGTASVTIVGKNLYCGSKTISFKIKAKPISDTSVTSIAQQTYTGSAITPKPVIKLGTQTLREGTDYSIASYNNNVTVGTATITVNGKGNFSGKKNITFKIVPANLSKVSVSNIPEQNHTGNPIEAKPVLKLGGKTLVEGKDYTLAFSNNVDIGRASLSISGKGNFTGTIETGFDITVPTIRNLGIQQETDTGYVRLDISLSEFKKVFSYGDSLEVEFSNGYCLTGIPYYNGFYAKLGEPLVVSYSDAGSPTVSTNYGERVWDFAGLSTGDTATVRLVEKAAYKDIQDALNITYSDQRSDFSSNAAFANFRRVSGGALSGNLYRSASPVNNWRKRAAYASALAENAGIQCILNLSDNTGEIRSAISSNHANGIDTSYFEGLFAKDQVIPIDMNSSYATPEYRTKIAAGLSEMSKHEGPYLVHCIEGKDRTGFTCLLLAALAGASYDEMLTDYATTYENYCGITASGTPEKYRAVTEICFDSMIGFLMDGSDAVEGDYAQAARDYLIEGGMSSDDIDLLVEKITS